jgi:hypothetical protein
MSQEVIEVTEREIEVIEIVERGPVGPTGPQPDINYTVVSTNTTLQAADLIAADTSGGAFTLTLPASPSNGDAVDIFDFSDTFDTNNLTIARNGSRIESLEENLVCNVEGAYFTLIYTGATRGWQVLPRYGTSGGAGESTLTTTGDMLYRATGVNARLPIGAANQFLRVNSGATAPEWDTITASDVGAASTTHAATHADGGSDSIQPFTGVRFDTVSPDATPSVGQMVWNDNDGTVDMLLKGGNVNMQIGQSSIHRVYNDSGASIAKGKVVYIYGSQGQRTTVRLADNDGDTTSARTFGFTAESIADGQSGFVISEGILNNVSTSGLADGTMLWLGDDGNYVGTRPTQPDHGVFLGVVVKGNSVGAGSIFVKIQNGQELDELHDVLITSASAGQVLARNTGNTLWVNKTLTAGDVGAASSSHTHAAADITSGILDNARINFAAPAAIGNTTPAAGTFTTLNATNGTITASAPVLDLSQTWNNAAVTFTGLRFNVTNTASAVSSLLADFQVGGSSIFQFRRDGQFLGWANAVVMGATGGGRIEMWGSNFGSGQPIVFRSGNATYRFALDLSGSGSNGVFAVAEANNTFSLLNGVNSQTFRLYNTFTSATNHERGFLRWSSNVFQIGTEKGSGGGTARDVQFQRDGSTFLSALGGATRIEGISTNNLEFNTNGTNRWLIGGSSGALQSADGLPIRFGGSTTSFPRLVNSGAVLRCQLADGSGYANFEALLRAQGTAPATAGATGTAGDIRYDADYIYVCTATNTWKRAAIATW